MAIWMRSSFADSRNSYRLAGLLVGLSLVITVAGAPFGLMQGKGELGAALRFTQAQLPFAALLLMVVVQQGARWTTVFRSSFARFSGSVSYCLYLIHLSLGDGYQALVRHFGLRPDAMFGKLGERCRQIIQKCLGNKPQDEVAAELGVSYAYLRKKKSECTAELIKLIQSKQVS